MSDYSLVVMRPDGARTEQAAESIDDAWGRSIQFELSGLARSGSKVIGKIVEGGNHPVFRVVVFDLHTGTDQELEVPQDFLRAMAARCRESLRVIGTTRGGAIPLSELELKSVRAPRDGGSSRRGHGSMGSRNLLV